MKYLAVVLCFITFSVSYSLDFKFVKFEKSLFRVTDDNNGNVYGYVQIDNNATKYFVGKIGLNGQIDTVISYSKLQKQNVLSCRALLFWRNKLVFMSDKRGVYYLDGDSLVEFSRNDSYFKDRKYNYFTLDNHDNLIMTTARSEIIRFKNFAESEIIYYDSLNFGGFFGVEVDKYNSVWTVTIQNLPKKGFIRIDSLNKVSSFIYPEVNGRNDGVIPYSLSKYNNKLYFSIVGNKQTGYFSSLNEFDLESYQWTFRNDVFKNNPRYEHLLWNTCLINKISNYNNLEIIATSDDGIFFSYNSVDYKFLDLSKLNIPELIASEQIGMLNMVKHIAKINNKVYLFTAIGLLEIDEQEFINYTSIANIENNYSYKILQNKVHFENKINSSSYMISDEVGRQVKQGNFVDEVSFNELTQGVYFILLDNKQLIKIVK